MGHRLSLGSSDVHQLTSRLRDPRKEIDQWRQYVDDLAGRSGRAMRGTLSRCRRDAEAVSARLRPEHLVRKLAVDRDLTYSLVERLRRSTSDAIGAAVNSWS